MDLTNQQPLYCMSFEPIEHEDGTTTPQPALFPITEQMGLGALTATISGGPAHNRGGLMSGCGWSGAHAFLLRGQHTAADRGFARITLDTGLFLPVEKDLRFSYMIFPDFVEGDTDLSYTSHFVAVDLHFSDGTTLSSLSLPDQNLHIAHARAQGESRALFSREWNYIEVDLSPAAGKVITGISAVYDKACGTGDLFT
jgi:hypothetical protein